MQTSPFQDLLNRMMQTPSLDKLSAWAADVKAAEAEELELERRRLADQDEYWDRRAGDDDGEEVAA
jgi:hypothetical protein